MEKQKEQINLISLIVGIFVFGAIFLVGLGAVLFNWTLAIIGLIILFIGIFIGISSGGKSK
jgi:fatty acid desaturase